MDPWAGWQIGYIDGLEQDCSHSSALLQSYIKPPIYINTFKLRYNRHHFANNLFKFIFLFENFAEYSQLSN